MFDREILFEFQLRTLCWTMFKVFIDAMVLISLKSVAAVVRAPVLVGSFGRYRPELFSSRVR